MTNLFDGGHKQLFAAESFGLNAAWRRAAESVARHAPDEMAKLPSRRLAGRRALLATAAMTLIVGSCFIAASTLRPDEQVFIETSATAQ